MSFIECFVFLCIQFGICFIIGLDDVILIVLFVNYLQLIVVVDVVVEEFVWVQVDLGLLLVQDEQVQIDVMQDGFVNFYVDDVVILYVVLVVCGLWVVILKGVVLYDVGGYGMFGFGYILDVVLEVMVCLQVMVNIMIFSLLQQCFIIVLCVEIGYCCGGCLFVCFMCLNFGFEVVGLVVCIVDVNVKLQIDFGVCYVGVVIKCVVVKGSFYGCIDCFVFYLDFSCKSYLQYLVSYCGEDLVIIVVFYDEVVLCKVFEDVVCNQWFIEVVFLELVMGEGDLGCLVLLVFYVVVCELICVYGSLLLFDLIQVGLCVYGVLLVVDYLGFEGFDLLDMEIYFKVFNVVQYLLLVLVVIEYVVQLYCKGIYGNIMISNLCVLDVVCVILVQLILQVCVNIVECGVEVVCKLEQLKVELGGLIIKVQGIGLLFLCELVLQFKCYGVNFIEEWLCQYGINVIYGGENLLCFILYFGMDSEELDLLVGMVGCVLCEGLCCEQVVVV